MNKDLIFELLQQALVMFYKKEQRNLELDVHEICHAHRLAIYLEQQIRKYDRTHRPTLFKDYSVDIEVDRTAGGDLKQITNKKSRRIRCDIMIHSKGKNLNIENLLLLELKIKSRVRYAKKAKEEICTLVSPVPLIVNNANLKKMYNTLLGVYLVLDTRRMQFTGTKYWYENERVQHEEFIV